MENIPNNSNALIAYIESVDNCILKKLFDKPIYYIEISFNIIEYHMMMSIPASTLVFISALMICKPKMSNQTWTIETFVV